MSLDFEKQFYSEKIMYIAGCDEAGRGPLLGPVVASAVILPVDFKSDLINDSKKLSEKQRQAAFDIIKENAIAIGIGIVDADEIDEINIYEASRKAMLIALRQIKKPIDLVITDCMPLKGSEFKYIDIVKGDSKALCIAAASIIAKVTRDNIMYELDKKYPEYGIKKHKGYGTRLHLEALEKYGIINHVHRKSFKPVSNIINRQLSLF